MPINYPTSQKNHSNIGRTIWAILGITLLVVWLAVIWGLKSLHQDAIGNQLQESNNITRVLQEQQRQAERAHDNCRRDLQEQGATNEELNSEMQARLA